MIKGRCKMMDFKRKESSFMKQKLILFLLLFALTCFPYDLRGPIVQNVTPYSATISWWTDEEDSGKIIYSDGRETYEAQARRGTFQRVRLTNLKPSTLYTYRLEGSGYKAGPFSFRTAPLGFRRFRFAVYGDTRTQDDVHRAVLKAIAKHKPELALNTGDLVADGRVLELWKNFFSISSILASSVPLYTVLGNHEQNSPLYFRFLSLPGNERYYSFDWGDCHFVALDSDEPYLSDKAQLKWLEEDLERNKKARFIIVFFHHPAHTLVKGRENYAEKVRRTFCPILEKYRVSVVFNGHDHNYQHFLINGIHHIVTGGGGAPLYAISSPDKYTIKAEVTYNYLICDVEEDEMILRAYRLDGSLLDEIAIKPRIKVGPPFIEKFPQMDLGKRPKVIDKRK
jgi:predicted phosphodiesterase